jgi:membrane associated rhomboid family serine protease
MGMIGGKSDGVAYAAHIGGFLAGMLLIKFFDKGQGYVDAELAKRKRFM